MPGRVFERKKRRMPCNITFEGQQHSGLVLDVSPGGLFIQTSAKAKPGDRLDLQLSIPGEVHKLPLQVEVVRKVVVPARLLAIAHGGVGVRILSAPEAYYKFMETLGIGPDPGEFTPKAEARAESGGAPRKEGAAAPASTQEPQQQFRVRIKQVRGPRSRILDVSADSEDDARRKALAEVGEGWHVLEVDLK